MATIMTLITPGSTDNILYNNTDKHANVFSATQLLFVAKFEKQQKTSAAAASVSQHVRLPLLAVSPYHRHTSHFRTAEIYSDIVSHSTSVHL